jgi:hypothetical protein
MTDWLWLVCTLAGAVGLFWFCATYFDDGGW